MKDKKEEKSPETSFQGPVSLEAMFASKSKSTKSIDKPENNTEEEEEIVPNVVVEKQNIVEPTVQPSVVVDEEVEETESYNTAKRLIELGLLEDFVVQVSEEDEEGTSILDFKSMTEDNLQEILKIHKQEKENNISSNYIPKEGLKEHQLKVIEILKNGGDLSQIAETEEKAFERPFEGFDLEDQQRQIDILYTDLVSGKSLDHDSARVLIEKEISKGTLKDTATKIFDLYRDAHTKYIDEKLEEQRKKKEFKELNFKENKKALTAKLKAAGFKEGVYKKISAEYAKKNSLGEYSLLDKVKEILENPEENYEVIMHIADKNLFNESFKIKASQETQKTIVRLASSSASKGNKKSLNKQPENIKAPWLKAAEIHNNTVKK